MQTTGSIRDSLLATYGPLVDAKTICRLLCFRSAAAFSAARARGKLGLNVFEIEDRRGVFARTEDVAAYLERVMEPAAALSAGPAQRREASMTGK